jgi:hypothetical protein
VLVAPVSRGERFAHWPTAVALDAWRPTSVPVGTGTRVRSAEVMSMFPTSGTLRLVSGTLIGRFVGMPMPRLDTSPVAVTRWAAGSPDGPSRAVRADSTAAWSGMGKAGALAPALAVLHAVAPTLAATGAPDGWPERAVAEQFQPAADADPGVTTAPAAPTAARDSKVFRIEQTSMSLVSEDDRALKRRPRKQHALIG